jgi:hypothetical protein
MKRTSKECRAYGKANPWCEVEGCGSAPVHVHHIKSRGSGGGDNEANLISLCPEHHAECHTIGRWNFARKYYILKLNDGLYHAKLRGAM